MAVNKEQAKAIISRLVARFDEQIASYKSAGYNEAQARQDFINPFFKALGWDIDNEAGNAEAYREVIYEDKVVVAGATKAPDYSFRLPGGKRLFFVEAKKPSVYVKDEIQPAYQVRRYGWSAKLPISVITDFEEFAVYDCTKKPFPTDKASVSRIKYLTYKEYIQEFDFLWNTFSKEFVLKGSFDQYIQSDTNKRGTATVDKEFLLSLDNWRSLLAVNISRNNPTLDEDELNFVVQQTIDRIIFLRIAEDRSVEPYGLLKECVTGENFYAGLYDRFRLADEKYNSGLFDLKKDRFSKRLIIEDNVLKIIISELYYPESPYEFSVLSVEILGSAYEQFLGKVIRITDSRKAKIEEKPEVRKAGGVYYTPQYIVDYIVKNTVGKLIEGKTPKEIAPLTIVDPACGSGSFLLGAYQYLLDYHKNYYTEHGSKKWKKDSPVTPDGNLTSAEKKRILLNNIYGVDIDANAVEVTKLSLLLKCMEGETSTSIAHQLALFHERVLPTLDDNIQCGNSLIDVDFYDNRLDFGEDRAVKPFNWQKAFPQVFKAREKPERKERISAINTQIKYHARKTLEYSEELDSELKKVEEPNFGYGISAGGFDVVIGNPPWVDLKGHPPQRTAYYFTKYLSTNNRINLYAIFIEKALSLLSHSGKFSFIVPNSILFQSSYEALRKDILNHWQIENIVRLPDDTFAGVKAETIILRIGKNQGLVECYIFDRNAKILIVNKNDCTRIVSYDQDEWKRNRYSAFDIFSNTAEKKLLSKIEVRGKRFDELCDFCLGITPYDKYKGHSQSQIDNRVFHAQHRINSVYKPLLSGGNITRYSVIWDKNEYIKYGPWLGAPREKRFFTEPRILVRQIISGTPPSIFAGYTETEYYNTQSIFNILLKKNQCLDLRYILGLLNSKLINFYHITKYLDRSKRLFQKILIQNCRQFPILIPDAQNKKSAELYEAIISFVKVLEKAEIERIELKLHSKIRQLQQRIDYHEEKINQAVYELYGLTEKEIRIIEEAVK